ncbi:MAG: hypothetical protein JEZ12_26790 [Desulfobacterium sp.]|nr:hypothetical protein [Desulfobacterium sp.]
MKRLCFPGIIGSETGSFAVVMALSLMFLVSVLAFVLDLGYFTKEKGNYQACADAAAMAAAENLCCGRSKEAALAVAMGTNVLLPEDSITVTPGFYDIFDLYDDFGEYKDFVEEDGDDLPEGEYVNAMMVVIENKVESLTGFNKTKTIKAAAVSYVPGVDMVAAKNILTSNAKNHGGGGNIAFHNGNIYVGKKVCLYGVDASDGIKIATKPGGKISIKNYTGNPDKPYVDGQSRPADEIVESALIENYLIAKENHDPLNDYVKKMLIKADRVYTVGDEASGSEFYCSIEDGDNLYCFFDLSEPHEEHEIIYFNVSKDPADPAYDPRNVTAFITATPCKSERHGGSSANFTTTVDCGSTENENKIKPFGQTIKNLTFVSTVSISIPRQKEPGIEFGGKKNEQVNFVSAGDVFFSSGFNPLKGVSFFCQTFRIWMENDVGYKCPSKNFIKIIANNGSILFGKYDKKHPNNKYDFYLRFGYPCPRVFPVALGCLQ